MKILAQRLALILKTTLLLFGGGVLTLVLSALLTSLAFNASLGLDTEVQSSTLGAAPPQISAWANVFFSFALPPPEPFFLSPPNPSLGDRAYALALTIFPFPLPSLLGWGLLTWLLGRGLAKFALIEKMNRAARGLSFFSASLLLSLGIAGAAVFGA